MAFTFDRMNKIEERLSAWWRFEEQDRPCILSTIPTDGKKYQSDLDRFWSDPDLRTSFAIDQIDASTYLGEAVPFHYVDLGSSAMAALLGSRMEYVDLETVWAYPIYDRLEPIAEILIDRGNRYYRYLRETTARSASFAENHHFVTHFALGAPGDTLAALYGTEALLIDMVERPEVVESAMNRLKRIWIECFTEFGNLISKSGNRGSVGWAGVWAPGTTFPMQEDFSYMISPSMYRRFCLPHIGDLADAIEWPMYHLDGMGAIAHLDALLELEQLRVIQWVPGSGHEDIEQWYSLINRIIERGKSVQIFARAEEIEFLSNLGSRGVLITVSDPSAENTSRLADRYDI